MALCQFDYINILRTIKKALIVTYIQRDFTSKYHNLWRDESVS